MEVLWPKVYKKRNVGSNQQKFDTKNLTQNVNVQSKYKDHIMKNIQSQENQTTKNWDSLKSIITNAAKSEIGINKKDSKNHISDPELKQMSIEQKKSAIKN